MRTVSFGPHSKSGEGTDQDDLPVEIDPDGRPTALIFGATWCQPCEEGVSNARTALETLDPELRIYAVPHYTDETWPTVEWPHLYLFPEAGSPLNEVPALPAVLVLDGENTILFSQIGFDGLIDALAELDVDN